MTGRDLMPIGKHKGIQLDKLPQTYITWFCDQEWAEEKYPDIFAFFVEGEDATATSKEIETNTAEADILISMPASFSTWWNRAYGERLRQAGMDFYLPYMRVAREAWLASSKQLGEDFLKVTTPKPAVNPLTGKPTSLPQQPAKKPNLAEQIVTSHDFGSDEEVDF